MTDVCRTKCSVEQDGSRCKTLTMATYSGTSDSEPSEIETQYN